MDIEELIRYYPEGPFLDFKFEEYKGQNKHELIRDVLAFANASIAGDRYIIIGVKKSGDDIVLNSIEKPSDPAHIQQYIHENIGPELEISYEPFLFENKQLMVLKIHGPNDQPYFALKNLQNDKSKCVVRENEILIRKGSYKKLISRIDLDRIYSKRFSVKSLEDKISVVFEDGTKKISVPCARNMVLPSQRNKHEILRYLRQKEAIMNRSGWDYLQHLDQFIDTPKTHYSQMDIRELKDRLQTVEMNYKDEDYHYIHEERAYRLSLKISNTSEQHLENAVITLRFPKLAGFTVSPGIALNTYQQTIVTGINYQKGYPKVTMEESSTFVQSEIGDIRHMLPALAFEKPLRLAISESLTGQSLKFIATIHGRNLPTPQNHELELEFV
ncbi:hypothetical protein BEL04_18205 [Mucilaginibacter sp. PPCGB 2223]|uniref:AlbA family DNA-binding domain-containing protein n=1 Tax=Mucilaginibacter sp. PPCGB 2223 TaxID=1886027 RepID=UPI0008259BC4|nr:ATP-binding protein [Mucilaginibacter sp. PPCGB 2223]OCX51935.1 hypothetical protein BEL04_18205 [Mucilaginibacter sp. PPCGB 2223]